MREKNRENTFQIPLTSYQNFVGHNILRMIWRAKWISADGFDDITEEDINKCIEDRSKISLGKINAREIDAIVRDVRMNMGIKEASIRF